MKFLTLLPLTLVAAQDLQPDQDLDAIDEFQGLGRNIKTTRDMLTVALNGLTGSDSPAYVAKILVKNYGCYCFTNGNKIVGSRFNYNGPAVDQLDNLCRNLYNKQKCLYLDAEEGLYNGQNCEATTKFEWYQDINGDIQCGNPNDPSYVWRRPCKMNNCYLEREFVEGAVAWYTNSNFNMNTDYRNMNDSEYISTCGMGGQGGNGSHQELKCCGEGVERKTFNSLIKECCVDGSVAFIGSCP